MVRTYFKLGVEHILLGFDHLLFVLALLFLVEGWRRLLGTITAFTVAHSLTLAAATFGWVQVPQAPVEAVIALSIMFVAVEILHRQRGRTGIATRKPWVVAFVFGLLHGLGFAGALREIGLPDDAIPLALAFFNVGVEAGQLLVCGRRVPAFPACQSIDGQAWRYCRTLVFAWDGGDPTGVLRDRHTGRFLVNRTNLRILCLMDDLLKRKITN